MSVSAKFNKYAESYDQSRQKLIPCYSDFYKTVIKIIPFAQSASLSAVDLGAGTGLLSKQIIEAYPLAHLTLVDISEEMLVVAQNRLCAYSNIDYQLSDYAKKFPAGNFDLIVSSLSIHHLSDKDKIQLFQEAKKALKPNGMFINADQVLGETEEIEEFYHATWLSEVKQNSISETELNAALDRMKEDRMTPLSNQLTWLRQAGFSQVNCWYKNLRFAVYSGVNI